MNGGSNSNQVLQILQNTFQSVVSILQSLCTGIRELFFQGFGDANASFSRDFALPAVPNDWILIASLSNPAIVYLRNLSLANEFEFTWNKSDAIGGRIAKTEKLIFDRVIGNLYARASVGACDINISVISLKLSD